MISDSPRVQMKIYECVDDKPYCYEIVLEGIKNECCKNPENIAYTKTNEFLGCVICGRLFSWNRVKRKIGFFERLRL